MERTTDAFRGKGILITGGAGYLASGLVSLLKHAECHIVRLDRHDAHWEPVAGTAHVTDVCGDVRDPAIWDRNLEHIDFIFHLAAQTSTYVANARPADDQATNVMPMLHLLEACRRQGKRPTLCFSSTATVAGIPERLPVDETHQDHPLTIYDLHKQMAEQYLRWYAEQGVVHGVTLRLANVYGPGPRSSRSDRGILNQMIHRALAGDPLTVYGAGDYLRDYVYVDDVARAFIAAARHGEKLNGRFFVIGSGQGHTIAEAMHMIARRGTAKTGRQVTVQHVEPPDDLSPIEQRHFVADSRLFSVATGWSAHYALDEGIDRTMEAFS
ncbi:NAD-dependent epimerase/dehydratase family protein [Geobacter sp. FeAm09]|uniref:NAD-dependent epimerase/dehydratase family protein n=1 Tax=Geobacter sp. FeAm09 TaxID=2597769 RepID=UPI0011ED921F|nr:NAD-dependent epimerase/dehydratase family protein [Geobacter sp. FeAm09]QEM66794.1 NAD-dependent epimerase/dehydratase family protein [Geobacter sp. FeAm09]